MDDDGSVDNSEDKDYADMSDPASYRRCGTRHSRKRVKRTKDREHNDVESHSTPSLDVSCQSTAATSSSSMHESGEMPIHRYFTLKTVGSKVVYYLTFSQELLPYTQHQEQRQDSTTNLEKPQSAAPDSGVWQAPLQRHTTRRPWTREGDAKLRKIKKKGHSWDEIHAALSYRSKGTMQVRYSTKLKNHRW